MRRVIVHNRTKGVTLAAQAEVAQSVWTRFVGLMGRRDWSRGDGLVILPSSSIHTFFMRIPLDVCHLDKQGRLLRGVAWLKPWRLGPIIWRTHIVIELPGGTLARTGTVDGDEIELASIAG